MRQSSRTEERMDKEAAVTRFEDEVQQLVRAANNVPSLPPRPPREMTQFEQLGDQLGKELTVAAQALVTEAQNFLEEIERWTDQIRQDVQKKVDEYQELVERQKKLRSSLTEAHGEYVTPKKPDAA